MKALSYLEVREKYLEFMKSKGHAEIPNASLLTENDPSLLFVNAGMVPLVPFLMGEKHPLGNRLTNSQKSFRTIDIDEVGDEWHCTCFEMLGNWSLNDYFKKEAIGFTVEFFVEILGLEIEKLYGSVYSGDEKLNIPQDDEAIEVWKDIFKSYGIDANVGKGERIQLYDGSKNWWGLDSGGPCGPTSELFYDTGKEPCGHDCHINCNCGKYVEVGNNVFMQFLKKDGEFLPLGRHNVDFGGGLERITGMLQGVNSYYELDIFAPVFEKVKNLSKNNIVRSQRIVTDHIKAAIHVINEGVKPGRTEREYVLRRLIRRAIRHGMKLGIEGEFTAVVAKVVLSQFQPLYVAFKDNEEMILSVLQEEEQKFRKTIKDGVKEVEKVIENSELSKDKLFTNDTGVSFKLYETYGFPPELFIEELNSRDIKVDEDKFWENHNKAHQEHVEKSRTASQGMFKGGLADTGEMSTKYHTATHLLLRALYQVLGDHIYQKGSNITPERLRLDFPNEEKLTPEQLQQVEDIVNEQIQKGLDVTFVEMPKEEALKLVPYAAFEHTYPDMVKVYSVGPKESPFSLEICNGPHVSNTKELGKFKITKQENVGAGIKRIKAVLE